MAVTRGEVERVAELAGLGFSDSELIALTTELNSMLEHFDAIADVDVSGVVPATRVMRRDNVTRPDVVGEMLTREAALANAPDSKDGCFRVPLFILDD